MNNFLTVIFNPVRYEILKLLNNKPLNLKDIIDELRLDYAKASLILYHLRILQKSGLIEKLDKKKYMLTSSAKSLLRYLSLLETAPIILNEDIYILKTTPPFEVISFSEFLNSIDKNKLVQDASTEIFFSKIKELLLNNSKRIISEDMLFFLLKYYTSNNLLTINALDTLILKYEKLEEFLINKNENGLLQNNNLIESLTLQYIFNRIINEMGIRGDLFKFVNIPNLSYFISGILCLHYPLFINSLEGIHLTANEIIQLILLKSNLDYKDLNILISFNGENNYESLLNGIFTLMQLIVEYLRKQNVTLFFSLNYDINSKLLLKLIEFFTFSFNEKLIYPNLFYIKVSRINNENLKNLSLFSNLFTAYPYLRITIFKEHSRCFSLTSYGLLNENSNDIWGIPTIATLNLVNVASFNNYNEDKIFSYLINLIDNIYKIFKYKNNLLNKLSNYYNGLFKNKPYDFSNYYLNLYGFYESIQLITNKSFFNDDSAFNLANKFLRNIIEILKEKNLKNDFQVKLSLVNDTISFKNKPFNPDFLRKSKKILRDIKLHGLSSSLTPDWFSFGNLKEKIKNELRLLKYFEGGFIINLPVDFNYIKINEIILIAKEILLNSPLKHLVLDIYSIFTFCNDCKTFFHEYHLKCPNCKNFNLKYLSMHDNQLRFFNYSEAFLLIKKHYYST
jgi:predicted transcriptional regulator